MYVCVRLHSCMCVWDYIHVCKTTFMYVCLKLHLCVCLRLHSHMFVWTMCTKNLSNYEITKIKVVDLHELFNFGIHYFFNWNDLGVSNFGSNLSFFKFQNLKGSNLVKWQDNQNKSCRSWWVEQLLYSSLLHLKSFRVLKFGLNLSNFKF